MQLAFLLIFWVGFVIVLFTTIGPLTSSVQWWVRGWDFPRIHIAVLAVVIVGIGLLVPRQGTLFASAILLVCVGYQAYRIYPYTFLAKTEIALNSSVPDNEQVSIIAANVLKENTKYDALVAALERQKPDIIFLMEIDDAWIEGISDHLATYSTIVSQPQDNHYGLVFATNLDVISAKVVHLSDDAAPALLAEINSPTGPFFFVGLHPKPPVPGNTTIERDEQIKKAALIADRKRLPVIAMGDFNDAAWSWTSQRFKDYGEFRDPRIGRAMLPSFDANSWFLRFPIDQLYLTEGFELISFDRLAPVGSDHFPMHAKFSVTGYPK